MRGFFLRLSLLLGAVAPAVASPMLVYLGTYTQTSSKGIYVARFDPETGSLSDPELAAEARNPTFLSLGPGHTHLYASGELKIDPAPKTAQGGATAFAIDRSSGKLKFINQEPTGGGATTYNIADASGRMLVVANYGAGYAASLPIRPDGSLGPRTSYFEQGGKAPLGPNQDRQQQSHPHSVSISPDNRFAAVCDLGLDRVFIYRLDPADAKLAPNDPPMGIAPPGAGPRHSKFTADGTFLYVANEMGGSVTTYAYDAATGTLTRKGTADTLPAGYHGPTNTVAEIRISPDQRFVYASNRGHESIAVFSRDLTTGALTRVEIAPCGGKHPRNFALDPSGRWLLCANRDTNNVVVFKVAPDTGKLTPTGREITVGQPVCVLFCP